MQSWVVKSNGKCMSHVCGAENADFAVTGSHEHPKKHYRSTVCRAMFLSIPDVPCAHVVNQYFTVGVGVQIC